MKKWLFGIVAFLLLIGATGAFVWSIRAKLVAGVLSKQLGTPVRIESIELSTNSVEINKLEILTPSDEVFPKALTLDSLRISASFFNLIFGGVKEINEVSLNNLFVGIHIYNQTGTQSNWSNLISNIQKDQPQEEGSSQTPARFVIDRLDIQPATLHLQRPNRELRKFAPFSINLTNIGSSKPASITQIVTLIVSEVMTHMALKYGLPKLFNEILKSPGNLLEGLGDQLKRLPRRLPFFKAFPFHYLDETQWEKINISLSRTSAEPTDI